VWSFITTGGSIVIVLKRITSNHNRYTVIIRKQRKRAQGDAFFRSKLCALDTDDAKQKTSLFSVQGKPCLVLFHGFCIFVLHHLCLVHKVNAFFIVHKHGCCASARPDQVVQKLDKTTHWINLSLVDNVRVTGFPNTYLLDNDLSSG